MAKHILDKPILRHIFAGIVYRHLLKDQERMNHEINMVLDDLKKKEPKVKIEKLRNALGSLIHIKELQAEGFDPVTAGRWEREYLTQARQVLKETEK
jgi:hypothetical protein